MKTKKYILTKSLRFTAAEWAIVGPKLAGRKWSAVVRALLLGTDLPVPKVRGRKPMSERDAKFALALIAIENNLNQLAHAVNKAALAGERIELKAMLVGLLRRVQEVTSEEGVC